MILRTTTGRSFKGVGKYVLHDKGAQSTDRVSFIETENLAFADGNRAIAEMVHTATHQKELKRRAGLRATQNSKPVYHLSLSWDTSEKPSLKEQMQAGREALKALGLSDHQAMIVGHTDTENPHVHVVVNLVCPTTGKTASLSNDRTKLSKWAEQYRKERGQEHFCPQRKANNERRAKGEFVKAINMSRQEYDAWKKSQTKEIWDEFRADRQTAHDARKGQFDALWQQKDNRIAERKAQVKSHFKPQWRDLFKRQRAELKSFDAGFFDRLGFAMQRQGRSKILGFLEAITNDGNLRADFMRQQDAEKKMLGNQHKQAVRDASREVTKAYKYDLAQLKDAHKQQDQERYEQTKAKSAEVLKSRDPANERTSRSEFDETADRRKPENQPVRDHLESSSEPEKEKARGKVSGRMRESRGRTKGRTRSRKRTR